MKVMINDGLSFYQGRVADVKETREICGMKVYWVSLPSGTATVEFAIRESNVIEVPEIV